MAVVRQILYADRDGEAGVLMKELLVPHELLLAESVGQARILARQHRFDIYIVAPVDPHALLGTIDVLIKLAQFESIRGGAAAQRAILEELGRQPSSADEIAADAQKPAEESRNRRLLFKPYRAFKDAGGNRANFERQWPKLIASSRRDTAELRDST